MQVKSYLDTSLPRAILRAKQELGNEIIIIESRDVVNHPDYPGKKMVKVTVGLSPEDEKKQVKKWVPPSVNSEERREGQTRHNPSRKDHRTSTYSKVRQEIEAKNPPPKTPPREENQFNDMISNILNRQPKELDKEKNILDEISKLRREITELSKKSEQAAVSAKAQAEQLKGSAQEPLARFPEPYKSIQDFMLEKGVQEDIAYDFINRAFLLKKGKRNVKGGEVLAQLRGEMKEILQPYDFTKVERSKKQRVVLLLGPTGAGKSTAAMKLASHPEIYGKKRVAILSTDPYGPSEALKAFARMSETAVHEEKDIDKTEALLEKYKNKDVLIVDTPGKSPFDPNQLSRLEGFVKRLKPTDIFLVLSVGSDLKDLVLLCANYLLLKPNGIVFTKFDETTQPGKVFSILDVINLPVVSFCDGKKIFIDVHKGEPEYMFKKVLPQNMES